MLRPDGCWLAVRPEAPRGRPGLFLDRDGTVIEDRDYLADPDGVCLLPGAARAIREANAAGWPVVLVTNQSGIGRGLFSWSAFEAVQTRLASLLANEGATLDAVLACPFHPTHPWRKPAPGMVAAAGERLALDLPASWLAGDKADDLRAARAGGLRQAALVLTGYGPTQEAEARALSGSDFAVSVWPRLDAAAGLFG
jgi:D-glycero-D-manno-heptose 1,7-bisphosphate phosphatase